MTEHENERLEASTGTKQRVHRRRFLMGVGAGGLATAATVFGFASPAFAKGVYQCCRLCCQPGATHTVSDCEHGSYYVWTCTNRQGMTCYCCEHNDPCYYGCGPTHWSAYDCVAA